ncbi:hypothetical protein E0493_08890 [Roseomonas sp. M0104]|uniref:Lipoprotein n=1 Tax=Teichococcus coralli TaxID=2545983 RepID=A0A845B746_9PROT|nr:hypothetical protein [Pseudoroseomonas coralli]MXP63463.1 hypothetical protein [Pseudoroseomonas coralli]
MPPFFKVLTACCLLAGCATTGAQTFPQRDLAERLPETILGFHRSEVRPVGDAPGDLAITYRSEATGSTATVYLLRPRTMPLPDGAASPQVEKQVATMALATAAGAGSRPGLRLERGLDYAVTTKGATVPNIGCAEFRIDNPPAHVVRNVVCASGVAGTLVGVQAIGRHKAEDMELGRRYLSGFADRVVDLLKGVAPPEADVSSGTAAPGAPHPATLPPASGPLRRT